MIDRTIKNIKKYFKALEGILTAKISEKKYFTRFQKEYLQQKQQTQKNFFLSFLYIKGVKYKLDLISAEEYENAGVGH